jgi:hypothetical protein
VIPMDASLDFARIPLAGAAEALIDEASRLNPGPWVEPMEDDMTALRDFLAEG